MPQPPLAPKTSDSHSRPWLQCRSGPQSPLAPNNSPLAPTISPLALAAIGRMVLVSNLSSTSAAQLYGCSRQCGRPVGARCSMGFGPNPLINGLIQHTFKFNILFLEKIHSNTLWPDKTLSFSSQVTMMFQKEEKNSKTKKNQSEIFNWGLPCQARQAKKN